MVLTLAVILFVAWLIGLGLVQLTGAAIRFLFVLALIALILRLTLGHSARSSVTGREISGTTR